MKNTLHMPAAQKLAAWLEKNNLSAHAFGLSLKLDPQIIRDLVAEKRMRVDVLTADLIERGTAGAVGWRGWIPVAAPKKNGT